MALKHKKEKCRLIDSLVNQNPREPKAPQEYAEDTNRHGILRITTIKPKRKPTSKQSPKQQGSKV